MNLKKKENIGSFLLTSKKSNKYILNPYSIIPILGTPENQEEGLSSLVILCENVRVQGGFKNKF